MENTNGNFLSESSYVNFNITMPMEPEFVQTGLPSSLYMPRGSPLPLVTPLVMPPQFVQVQPIEPMLEEDLGNYTSGTSNRSTPYMPISPYRNPRARVDSLSESSDSSTESSNLYTPVRQELVPVTMMEVRQRLQNFLEEEHDSRAVFIVPKVENIPVSVESNSGNISAADGFESQSTSHNVESADAAEADRFIEEIGREENFSDSSSDDDLIYFRPSLNRNHFMERVNN